MWTIFWQWSVFSGYSRIKHSKNNRRPSGIHPYLCNMTLTTNVAFTRLIKVTGRLREFNFRLRPDGFYDVDVPDERSNRYFFRMVQEDGAWKMKGDNLPVWVGESEPFIADMLKNKEYYLALNNFFVDKRNFFVGLLQKTRKSFPTW
ncbi:MAG: hypothetical protein EOO01_41180, partial [Chitinophagaceae bacterium]